jgi:hypothetical protein
MLKVETCDSIEALLKAQKLAEKAADQRVQDWQAQVKEGDCFIQRTPDGLEIFGEVLGPGLGGENWRRCRCYSLVCPEGEVGSVHVSQMNDLINRERFESVRNKLTEAYKIVVSRLREERLFAVSVR